MWALTSLLEDRPAVRPELDDLDDGPVGDASPVVGLHVGSHLLAGTGEDGKEEKHSKVVG